MAKRLLWGILTIALGILFLLDVAIPDPVFLLDEILAGLLTALSALKTLRVFLNRTKALPGSAAPDKEP